MSQYGNSKNPPWARSGGVGSGLGNNQLLQYPQAQMFQNQMGFQNPVYSNVGMGGAVSYPTRNQLNSAAFQNASPNVQSGRSNSGGDGQNKTQRVFTGTVTKLQDNFGFVDENVFFQTSCCVKGSNPQIGDRVLVEAIYNAAMPFKWNATRIQVLPNMNQGQNLSQGPSSSYNAVPPPNEKHDGGMDSSGGRFSGGNSRFNANKMNQMNRNKNFAAPNRKLMMEDRKRPMKETKYTDRKAFTSRERSPDKPRDRSRGRTAERSASRSPMRDHKRSKSPVRPAKRRRTVARYAVSIPKFPVVNLEMDASDIKRRYSNMYIPSDFMLTKSSWINSFPLEKPFSMDFPCKFHICPKEVDQIGDAAPLEPSDVDYLFSAKVILLASPGFGELVDRCTDDEGDDGPTPLSKLVSVLVGTRGREPLALGGPWSPSVDGLDPETDPGVLVRTAVRNVLSLTGIDLSNCTQWYRFLEIYYYRGETVHKEKTVPARVETVVLFIPDVWSCLPTRDEWTSLQESYRAQLNRKLNGDEEPEETPKEEEEEHEETEDEPTRQPTHHSLLDPKTIQMNDLKEELVARGLSPKGLKNQLIARLVKALKTEAEEEEKKKLDEKKKEEEEAEKRRKDEEKKRELDQKYPDGKKDDINKLTDEKEKQNLERKYKMPDSPHILVHPDRTAKSGRFDCNLMTLSSLLNYRPEDNKEHSYELFLFAEAFNGMLVRDFGAKILHAIHEVPVKKEPKEKKKEVKDVKEKDKEKTDGKKKDGESVEETVEDDDQSSEKDRESLKDKDEKKEEKAEEPPKKIVVDKELLLAFQYFDGNHCGYILDKDLEELFFALGLVLSRSQVKRLIQKVVEKESVFYKKLIEKPAEPVEIKDEEISEFQCNRELMPTFDGEEAVASNRDSDDQGSGYISYKGKLVDIGKLLEQLNRNEVSRNSTEKVYEDLLRNHQNLKEQFEKATHSVSNVSEDLMKARSSLSAANIEINNLQNKLGRYTSVIFQVKSCVEPVIRENTSTHSEKMKTGTKWDTKDIKKETVEDVKDNLKKKSAEDVMEVSDSESESKVPSKDGSSKKKKIDKTKNEKSAGDIKGPVKVDVKTEPESKKEKQESDTKKEGGNEKVQEAAAAVEGSPEKEPDLNQPEEEKDGIESETEEPNDKDTEEEMPKKKRKIIIPTPKKATPARRSAKRS